MYNKQQIIFIDSLLGVLTDGPKNFETLLKLGIDLQKLENIITEINKDPLKFIEVAIDTYSITPLGRKVCKLGLEVYLKQVENQEQLDLTYKELAVDNLRGTKNRSWIAIFISVVAIILTFLFNVLDYNEKKNIIGTVEEHKENTSTPKSKKNEIINVRKDSIENEVDSIMN